MRARWSRSGGGLYNQRTRRQRCRRRHRKRNGRQLEQWKTRSRKMVPNQHSTAQSQIAPQSQQWMVNRRRQAPRRCRKQPITGMVNNQNGGTALSRRKQHGLSVVSVSGNLATKMQAPTATRAHTASSYLQSVPGAKAYVETFGMQYALSAKGLSDIQIRRACEKAWLETFHQMGIVLDKQYEPEQIHQFHNAVRAKADRIVECKRRRCARSKRQPTTDCATDKV